MRIVPESSIASKTSRRNQEAATSHRVVCVLVAPRVAVLIGGGNVDLARFAQLLT